MISEQQFYEELAAITEKTKQSSGVEVIKDYLLDRIKAYGLTPEDTPAYRGRIAGLAIMLHFEAGMLFVPVDEIEDKPCPMTGVTIHIDGSPALYFSVHLVGKSIVIRCAKQQGVCLHYLEIPVDNF